MATLYTLAAATHLEKEIRRSIFLANAAPVTSAEQAQEFIRSVSVADATHNCWAWRIGQEYRSDDAGEPGGTAGRPILHVMDAQGMDRIVVVVTRWFGGIKLGAGGLVRAYGGTAAECLRLAERVPLIEQLVMKFHCAYADMAVLRARLDEWGGVITSEDFDGEGAAMEVSVARTEATQIATRVVDLTSGRSRPRLTEP